VNDSQDNQTSPKSIVAIAICVLFYIGWNKYLSEKYPDWNKPPAQVETAAGDASNENVDSGAAPSQNNDNRSAGNSDSPAKKSPAAENIAQLSDSDLRIATDTSVYEFSQYAGGLKSITLNKYMDKKGGKPIDLTNNPFVIQATLSNSQFKPYTGDYKATREGNTVGFSRQAGAWKIGQSFTVPKEGYTMDIAISYTNTSDQTQILDASFLMRETMPFPKVSGSFLPGASQARPSYIYSFQGEAEREDIEGECNDADPAPIAQMSRANIDYVGIDNHYFLKVLLPETKELSFKMHKANAMEDRCDVIIVGNQNQGEVKSGETVKLKFKGFFGPKDMAALERSDARLSNSIDFGFFGFIAKPLLLVVQGFYNVTRNYGVAIIITTLLLKFLFFPLMKASSTSMHKMKKLNPQMQEIREKFKDNKQAQQQAMMKFMSENKMNPMKGCFPILPQIPVFFAFWQVLRTSIDLRHAEFMGWIVDLTAHDAYYVTPVLMGIAMFAQQKLTPTTGMDKTQEKVMMFIPIMFTIPMMTFPAGMTVYMLTNTLTSIAQQRWLYYKLDKQEINAEA
jgi:YidC/Oxa1 family membrane protein insertase